MSRCTKYICISLERTSIGLKEALLLHHAYENVDMLLGQLVYHRVGTCNLLAWKISQRTRTVSFHFLWHFLVDWPGNNQENSQHNRVHRLYHCSSCSHPPCVSQPYSQAYHTWCYSINIRFVNINVLMLEQKNYEISILISLIFQISSSPRPRPYARAFVCPD